MAHECDNAEDIRDVTRALGCEERLKTGSPWDETTRDEVE
jgi:hypothetical protein